MYVHETHTVRTYVRQVDAYSMCRYVRTYKYVRPYVCMHVRYSMCTYVYVLVSLFSGRLKCAHTRGDNYYLYLGVWVVGTQHEDDQL